MSWNLQTIYLWMFLIVLINYMLHTYVVSSIIFRYVNINYSCTLHICWSIKRSVWWMLSTQLSNISRFVIVFTSIWFWCSMCVCCSFFCVFLVVSAVLLFLFLRVAILPITLHTGCIVGNTLLWIIS